MSGASTAGVRVGQAITSPWLPRGGNRLNQDFGTWESIPSLGINAPHQGVDIAVQSGDPVVLPAGLGHATVLGAGWDNFGGGNFVKLGMPDGTTIDLFHLQNVAVKMGQIVNAGELLGHADSTGNSTGPHLHFQVNQGASAIDPWKWLTSGTAAVADTASVGGSLNPLDAVKNVNDFFGHLISPGHDPCSSPADEVGVLRVIDAVTCPQNWWKVLFSGIGVVLIGVGVFIYFIREEKSVAITIAHDAEEAAPVAAAAA